jgi:hypothetical protein
MEVTPDEELQERPRAAVTTACVARHRHHPRLIDRPKDPERPEAGWPERGHDQTGKPWVDAKTWAVARVLDDHMDREGACSPSYGTIAEHARVSRSAAKDGVARLLGAGLLERKQRRITATISKSNEYRAAWGWGCTAPGGGVAPPPKVDGSSTHSDRDASQSMVGMERCSLGGESVDALDGDGLCPRCAAIMASGDTEAIQRLFALAASRG